MKKVVNVFAIVLVATSMMSSSLIALKEPTRSSSKKPLVLQPTKMVTIKPPYGYYVAPVRARYSKSEVDIVRRMQKIALTWNSDTQPIGNTLRWRIEPSAANSPTLALGIKAFYAARAFLSIPINESTVPITIIVGRTQEFLRQQVNALGCQPQLALYEGAYIMGATICNRSVIVINLTGYLFVRSLTQRITTAMEQRREPALSATSYLIVGRNISGLAHEWAHVARNRLTDGFVPDNEPAWFREGLGEVISGLALVKSTNNRLTYNHFHMIRLRKFSNWYDLCGGRLSKFRANNSLPRGCEYLRGAAALELLIANYGGIPKIVSLYEHMRATGDFFSSFKFVYKMTVPQFEVRADKYTSYISQAERYGKR
jgi:hypothetical protein